MFNVQIGNDSLPCAAGEKLLLAMERLGQRVIPIGCRGGGCGICRVRVLSGAYRTLKMSRAQVSLKQEGAGYALACRLIPESDLALELAGRGLAVAGTES